MHLNLTRVDYVHVGTTNRGSLRIIKAKEEKASRRRKSLLSSFSSAEKVVVGAQNGSLLAFERKKNETAVVFKTPPGPAISVVRLGGALGAAQDRVFAVQEKRIVGYSKKGKNFLTLETNFSENIHAMFVYGVDLFLSARNVFMHLHDTAESATFRCNDFINDVLCLQVTEGGWVGRGITPVLACDDKTLKVLSGSEVAFELLLGDSPSVLHLFMNDGGFNKQMVLYGTKNGRLGLAELTEVNPRVLWEIPTKSTGGISAIHCYPITSSDYPDIVLGKDDGLIEIYGVDMQNFVSFKQSYECNESITGLQCGRVGNENFDEVVVCSYTGWVFGLTTEPVVAKAPPPTEGAPSGKAPMEVKVQQLRTEVDELETKLREEKAKYEKATQSSGGPSRIPRFGVNDQFVLDKLNACYSLSIELIVPIDIIVVQSDVLLDLMDIEKSNAVVSKTVPQEGSGNAVLALIRCGENVTRLEIRLRSSEGTYGTIRVYICPKTQPRMCQVGFWPSALRIPDNYPSFFDFGQSSESLRRGLMGPPTRTSNPHFRTRAVLWPLPGFEFSLLVDSSWTAKTSLPTGG
uniref:Bardet-Biedl syndrome 7 protein homolog n=1 Tax=Steinernema glaseri TaxID=37863 RepID=A0A1I7YSZ1_9BILA